MTKNRMNRKTKQFLTLILLTFSLFANAQLYPVQVTPVLTPPYNLKLSSYATTTDVKLRVNILLRDVNEFNRQVRLKLIIKGQGLNIQSQQFVNGASPIYLNGGTNKILTNLDLSAYFQLNNLLGINPIQYNRPLPDGQYNFCFEVYDYFTNQRISNTGCFPVFLIVNDPPFLNLPQRGEQIVLKDPVNIIFQWTPRHLNATNVTYEYEIREIWDNQIDPQAGFLASPPLYSEITRATTFLYNNTKPALLPDKTYAWRVKAISTTGISENSIFRNNGYSEIYNFRTTQNCDAPKFPLSEAISKSTVKINWQGNLEHNKYHVQYRKVSYSKETEKQKEKREKKNKKRARKGQKEKEYTSKKENFEWFEVYTYNEQAQISNLEAGETYEFRVGGTCTSLTEFKQYYSYTNTNEFTMPTEEETVNYNCGVLPDIQIANQDPIQNIGVNETFIAGDFPVTVKEVQNNGGKFTGKGFIVVPYLADTKIAVAFEGITINTNYQLIEGVVKTTYDPNWGNVESVNNFLNDAVDAINAIENLLENSDEFDEDEFAEQWLIQEEILEESLSLMNNLDLPAELKEEITQLIGNTFLASTSKEIPTKKEFDTIKEELNAIKEVKSKVEEYEFQKYFASFEKPTTATKFKIHQRSFAPWKMFGSFLVNNLDRKFEGDNRGFSLKENVVKKEDKSGVTSRLYQRIGFENSNNSYTFKEEEKFASETIGEFNFYNESIVDTIQGEVINHWYNGKSFVNKSASFKARIQGSNPGITIAPDFLVPDIDWTLKLECMELVENKTNYLLLKGEIVGKGYPAYETFIEDANGNKYFLWSFSAPPRDDLESELIWPFNDVFGDGNEILLKFEYDDKGMFTGTIFKGNVLNGDWYNPIHWFKKEEIQWQKTTKWNNLHLQKVPSPDCGEYEGECGGLKN